ncbi:ADP-heptose:LPS heptosyltransferase [Lishizhenia tianjinensis]|uniref:ADP-heptose:LPS heptosyltransferase n=1 Tax=Lishizhenia tianjinensis TaxID=477690 RepID=A0A1I7BGP6_9FLAO|nr:glycosyltransferase family 9 protein [Lishizhenia tianjinensis]SFT86322.1 ADP-heptose:LPS heptosyltransferase [Lishizhenia tianjinensis]
MSKTINLNNKTVVISRTDSIGDVVLTLPMCAWLKQQFPECKIVFLGQSYTRPVLESAPFIDEILEWNKIEALPVQSRVEELKKLEANVFIHVFPNKEIAKLAKKAKIPFRIGTSHRSYHFLSCNIKPNFTRRKSEFHEAQLNFELLRSYGIKELPSLKELSALMADFHPKGTLPQDIQRSIEGLNLEQGKKKVILHARSQGSAVEWDIEKFSRLAKLLADNGHAVFYTGTNEEGVNIRGSIPTAQNVFDVTGKLTLAELQSFILQMDTLVACSTGPLHLAGILGIEAIGLFSPRRPIHPGRWMPLGEATKVIVHDEDCELCAKGEDCDCITKITAEKVYDTITSNIEELA